MRSRTRQECLNATDSERQRRDVAAIMAASGESLDRSYVDRWVAELGLGSTFDWVLRFTPDFRDGPETAGA